jgi:4-amino-4-deoxy-L-arabinose transferase-like glycosyltransferase
LSFAARFVNFRLMHANRRLWILIGAFASLRLLASVSLGLGGDEAYYAVYARRLALSYFDHPPLVGWFHALFQYPLTGLFGFHDWIARLPAILLVSLSSGLIYRLIFRVSGDANRAFWSVVALNASPLMNVLGFMLLPDTFLLVTVPLLIFVLMDLEQEPTSWRRWLALGLLLGISGLAKYTAFLLLIPTAVFLLVRRILRPATALKFLGAAILGLILVSPVFIWNHQHDWASFRYQGDHVVGSQTPVNWRGFFLSVGRQFLAYGPPLFLLSIYGLYRAFRSQKTEWKIAAWTGAAIGLFFGISSLFKVSLPHWTSPFFVMFIPLGYFFLGDFKGAIARHVRRWSLALCLGTVAVGYLAVLWKPPLFSEMNSPFRDVGDYRPLLRRANEELARSDNPIKAIGVQNWSLAGRVMYYNLPYRSDVKVIDTRFDQFDIWNPQTYAGGDILFLVNRFIGSEVGRDRCREVQEMGTVDVPFGGTAVDRYSLVWCKGFGG